MEIEDAQREVRSVYIGGFWGQLVSAVIWLVSAALGTWVTPRASILALVIAGFFIFPLTQMLLHLSRRPARVSKENPLHWLGMQVAFVLPFSMLLLVPVGFSLMVQLASSNTLIQSMVPDRLRGRVMAVYSMMFVGMAPFGALLSGLLANLLGAPGTVMAGGFACIAGAIVFRSHLPRVRALGRELILAQTASGYKLADHDG